MSNRDWQIANKRSTKNWYADNSTGCFYKLERNMRVLVAPMNRDDSRAIGEETELDDGDFDFYFKKTNELLNLSYAE